MSLNTALQYPWLQSPFFQLQQAWQNSRFHHATLVQGTDGLGKAALLDYLGAGILCLNSTDLNPCGQCKSCMLSQAGNHPDLCKIDNGDSGIGIDEIRRAGEFVVKKSNVGNNQVIIINHIEMMSEAASNALLKTLEEPGAHVYLLLSCNQPERLLATILSRCNKMTLNIENKHQVYEFLHQRFEGLSEQQCNTLLALASFGPLKVLQWLKDLGVEQIEACQTHFLQWRNGQFASLQYCHELEQNEFSQLMFQHLLKQEVAKLVMAEPAQQTDLLMVISEVATMLNRFNEQQHQIKGQNKTLNWLNLLNRIERLLPSGY